MTRFADTTCQNWIGDNPCAGHTEARLEPFGIERVEDRLRESDVCAAIEGQRDHFPICSPAIECFGSYDRFELDVLTGDPTDEILSLNLKPGSAGCQTRHRLVVGQLTYFRFGR